jgi:hypothetical protein
VSGKGGVAPLTIHGGDYQSFEVDLEEGKELVAEISASASSNVYVLDEENLNNLDSGKNSRLRRQTKEFRAPN